jgi:hypothetical protein
MEKEAGEALVKYIVLGLLREWYLSGKTQTTLAEIYQVLGARGEPGEPSELDNAVLTIGEEILTLDADHLDAVINQRIH